MGQRWEGVSSGIHWVQGQTSGQNLKCGRRGVVRNQGWALEPTRVARKPPPSGGGGMMTAAAGDCLPLQVCLGQSGAH